MSLLSSGSKNNPNKKSACRRQQAESNSTAGIKQMGFMVFSCLVSFNLEVFLGIVD
jgi:hypothetical protein